MVDDENIDHFTVDSFGKEWKRFDQSHLDVLETEILFKKYFSIFPWKKLPVNSIGFDMGCGSGRWANIAASLVGELTCIDPSKEALEVAKKMLSHHENIIFVNANTDNHNLLPASQDFGYSLGVLHHIPDTNKALQATVRLLKPGAPFLLYLYYRFDNRPFWFQLIWKISNLLRKIISKMPDSIKTFTTDVIAGLVYFPIARLSKLIEFIGINPMSLPLSFYRNSSFYTMRTDSRDRFGTPLEQRFTKKEISQMMLNAGLVDIQFSNTEPYWVAVGTKA